jgi:hypothetical protein
MGDLTITHKPKAIATFSNTLFAKQQCLVAFIIK